VQHADAAYTVAPILAGLFTEQYGKKFEVIYNMPQPLPVQSRTSSKQPIVIYQGDLNIGRGLEETMAAVADMDVMYWIVGDGPMRNQLQQQIEERGLIDKVKLLGKVLPQDLPAYTQQAMVGINILSGNSLSYQYSLANKFFDYVQQGVPVICADFPEYRRLNKEFEVGVLCEATPERIKQAIHEILNTPQIYQKFTDNCTRAAKVWNWQTQEKVLVHIYRNLWQ
jgi:glycosyltransferase involved in cell wall biosynthesis